MTVLYVAKKLGIDDGALGDAEGGRRRFGAEELQTLCGLLGMRPAQIYEEHSPRRVA